MHGFIPPVPTCCHGVGLYLAQVQLYLLFSEFVVLLILL